MRRIHRIGPAVAVRRTLTTVSLAALVALVVGGAGASPSSAHRERVGDEAAAETRGTVGLGTPSSTTIAAARARQLRAATTTTSTTGVTTTTASSSVPSSAGPSPRTAGVGGASATVPEGTAVVPPSPAGAAGARFGAYVGGGNVAGMQSFVSATGADVSIASDYLPGNDGWAGMSQASSLAWLLDAWHSTSYQLALGVPIIPSGPDGPVTTLAEGATGADDSYFATLAQTLVDAGEGNAILRLGWEFDGGWYNWSVSNDTDALNFAAYFRQIVTTMRAVPGANFSFVWNLSGGPTSWPVTDAYPGNAYVDYVGEDPYDETWATPQTPQVAWQNLTEQPQGLDWLASFGAENGKPVALPEWGLSIRSDGHGLGDDPYFVDQMGAWIGSHDVAWTSYFDADTSSQDDAITDGQFPNALAAFRQVFG